MKLLAPLALAIAAPSLNAPVLAQIKISMVPAAQMRAWQVAEMKISGVPLDGANPFDPDEVAVDVAFTAPSKRATTVPAFWYQDFTRALSKNDKGESEVLSAQGAGEWRVRWNPQENGRYSARITVRRKAGAAQASASTYEVLPRAKESGHGFARLNPASKRYFQWQDGTPLPLFGENLCWPGARGTFDYDDWLPKMQAARMNYARLWMWHQGLGAEFFGDERLRYNGERLWRLDYIFEQAHRRGINLMLCLDYHGIFQTQPDMWGGNDFWARHAYQKNSGGPCEKPNDFFTSDEAQALYRKRLRYLVARFAAFPNLLSWQFFNEINNVYGDAKKSRAENRDALKLNPPDVVAWHERQSKYLRALDPYKHLITTSFGSAGEQPEMWKLPSLDYANWHWYGNWSGRGSAILGMARDVGSRFPATYAKPVSISEFGTDGASASLQSDPLRRGLRQALWAGIFTGTSGTAMPWWWEHVHSENLYPLWASLRAFLPANFGSAKWAPRPASTPAFTNTLGAPQAGGAAFSEKVSLSPQWGGQPEGPTILNRTGDGSGSTLNGFVHGSSKPSERAPWHILANLGEGARLVLHLNSVSNEAILVVKQDGREIFRRELPNKDGGFERNDEYNEDIAVPLRAGRADISLENPGGDWLFLDWARLEGVVPSQPRTGPDTVQALAVGDGTQTLLWAVDNRFAWPRGRDGAPTQARGATVTLPALKSGLYRVQWWSPSRAQVLATQAVRAGADGLRLQLPSFEIDVAAKISAQK